MMNNLLTQIEERLNYLTTLKQTPEIKGRIKECNLFIDRINEFLGRNNNQYFSIPAKTTIKLCKSILGQTMLTQDIRQDTEYILKYKKYLHQVVIH